MRKVLVTPIGFKQNCPESVRLLEGSGFQVVANPHARPYSREELLDAACDADAVIAAFEQWDEEAFQAASRLQIVTRFGTGFDSVDLDAARRHGVVVCNCPGANAESVAEHTIALTLALARDLPRMDADVRALRWTRSVFTELSGKIFGIVGFGSIGQLVAKKLAGFDMAVLACNRSPRDEIAQRLNVRMCSFDELIRECDFISLHLPASPETRHLINESTIRLMKPGVRLINTARAALVDEQAVRAALIEGRIAGLASDVFSVEPIAADNPLLDCPGFIGTPHVASASHESFQRLGEMAVRSVLAVLEGREPDNRQA